MQNDIFDIQKFSNMKYQKTWTMIYFNNDYILSLNRIQIEDMKSKNDYHYVDNIIDEKIKKYIRESRKLKLQKINEYHQFFKE